MIALRAHKLSKTFQPRLRLDDLVRARLRPSEPPTRALDQASLHVDEGEIVGLVGPNGAGKTTLLKALATLVEPDKGELWVAGRRAGDADQEEVRRSIGLVTSEERSFYWRLTGRENLAFFSSFYGLDPEPAAVRLRRLSHLFHLEGFLDKRFDAYSSGMKQRLALVRALLHRPRVLLLDEPTRSVDPVESLSLRSTLMEIVREEDTAVLLVTHNLREVEMLCRRVLVMREGRLVFNGGLADLRTQVGGAERFILLLTEPLEAWDQISGVAGGEMRVESGRPELRIDLSPDSCVGDVVSGIHARGGRVEDVRTEADALERALTKLGSGKEEPIAELVSKPDVEPTLSKPVSRAKQIAAFLKRDLRIYLSYRFAFAMGLFGVLFNVAVFYYLAELVTEARIPGLQRYGADFFPFILIGIAFRGYLAVALAQFATALRSEQMMGTLEMLLAGPVRVSTLLTASSSFTFVHQTVTVGGYLLLGLLMGSLSLARMNLPVAALVMIPTVASFAAVGMLSAAFLMTFKRGNPVNFFINAAATLFGGVYFPVEVLPESLQVISWVLPITYSLEAMRKTLLTGAGLQDVGFELVVLIGFSVVLVPIGLTAFRVAVSKARRDGTLGQF